MKIFCTRLRERRGELSQVAFARQLGMNQQTYQRYETGVREPDLETLHQIGVCCGVSIDWLLGLSDIPPPTSPPDRSAELKREIEAVLRKY
jgi:transcriptional regulator with XRE-family HTH domain